MNRESHKLSENERAESLVATIQSTIRITNVVKNEANNYLKCFAFVAIMRRSVNERVAICFLINHARFNCVLNSNFRDKTSYK